MHSVLWSPCSAAFPLPGSMSGSARSCALPGQLQALLLSSPSSTSANSTRECRDELLSPGARWCRVSARAVRLNRSLTEMTAAKKITYLTTDGRCRGL